MSFLLLSCENLKSIYEGKEVKEEVSQNLKLCLDSEPLSLDPRVGGNRKSQVIIKLLFEGMTQLDEQGKVVLSLAKKIDISEDKKTYTFHLKDAKWNNGDTVTAYDFEYSWKRVIDPSFKSSYAYAFYPIKNARAINTGKKELEKVGIKVIDKLTLEVKLEHPVPYFLELTSNAVYFPIHRLTDIKNPNWMNPREKGFVSNGAFNVESWSHHDKILMKKNETFWNAKKVRLESIDVSIVENGYTSLMMFQRGESDWVGEPLSELPLDVISYLMKHGELLTFYDGGIYRYEFNVESYPLNSSNLRRALAHAIDRQAIIDHVLQGGEIPATSLVPRSMALHKAPYFPEYDLKLAKKFLDLALEELGTTVEELPPIKLTFGTLSGQKALSQAIQQQWQESLGLKIELESLEWRSFLAKVMSYDFQIAGIMWYSWYHDPIYNLEYLKYKDKGINLTRWESRQFIELLNAADNELNEEERLKLLHTAETIALSEMPVAPFYHHAFHYQKKEGLKNVRLSKLGAIDFRWCYFE